MITTGKVHLSQVLLAIKNILGINEVKLKERNRAKELVEARFMFSQLARVQLGWKDEYTAHFLRLNRSNMVTCRKKHRTYMEVDKVYADKYNNIKREIPFDYEADSGASINISTDRFLSSKIFDKKVYFGTDLY